jgi:hypothetical protein
MFIKPATAHSCYGGGSLLPECGSYWNNYNDSTSKVSVINANNKDLK